MHVPKAQICLKCGSPRDGLALRCPDCGASSWGIGGGDLHPTRATWHGPDALALPQGGSMLLYGAPGSGKTSLALQWLQGAPYLSSEMDQGTYRAYCRRLAVAPSRFVDLSTFNLDYIPSGCGIVDSVSASHIPDIGELEAQATRTARGMSILIAQITSEGTPRGGPRLPHLVHAVVRVDVQSNGARTWTLEKHRSKPVSGKPVAFSLGGEQVEPAYWRVDPARGGGYQLKADPLPRREDPGPWEEPELLPDTPPPPPCACSARWREDGILTGWQEPPDWQARRDYAVSLGIPYYSPTRGLYGR